MTRWLVTALFGCLVAACSNISVHTQYDAKRDFTHYQTFGWAPQPPGPGSLGSPQFRARLEQAIERALEAKGLRPAAPGTEPDLRLAYYARQRTERDIWVSTWGDGAVPTLDSDWGYPGYGWDEPVMDVRDYRVGTLVLDVLDARTGRLVWRGTARATVDPQRADQMWLQQADKLAADFPPHR